MRLGLSLKDQLRAEEKNLQKMGIFVYDYIVEYIFWVYMRPLRKKLKHTFSDASWVIFEGSIERQRINPGRN